MPSSAATLTSEMLLTGDHPQPGEQHRQRQRQVNLHEAGERFEPHGDGGLPRSSSTESKASRWRAPARGEA